MKHIILSFLLCLFHFLSLTGQENNPLINSGKLIEEGVSLHDKGEYKKAIELYGKITRGDTNYYRALYEMAYSQVSDSQYTAAIHTCELGLAFPNNQWPNLYTIYGNAIDDAGNSERALRVYDSAIRLYPAAADIYLNKGTTLLKMKRYADAENIFKQGVMINPYLASAHYKLGICAMQQGKIIQSFFTYLYYLLLQPSGRYHGNCITLLSTISKNTNEITELIQNRSEGAEEGFGLAEKIVLSKIALDKSYKPLIKLDDPVSRQIQVLLEKIEYDESSTDFYMQYYVPIFKNLFIEKKFEPLAYRMFANINIEEIQNYIKKNKKEVQQVVDEAVLYCNQLRGTRELNYNTRKDAPALYHFEDEKLYGKGRTANNGEILTGDWEFYFSPGNLRSKGSYNNKGEKENDWQYFHFDGRLKARQIFKSGKQNGEEIFYFENGVLSSAATFKEGTEDGQSKSYYWIGTPRVDIKMSMGKSNGERRTFFSNGGIKSSEIYKDDILEGPFKTYYNSGLLESKGNYKNGKLDGPYSVFYKNGKLSLETIYKEDNLEGPAKHYHENGKLKITENYIAGATEGEYTEYYDNGQLFYKTFYKKGQSNGDIEYFDRDGKRLSIFTFDNDILKSVKYFNKAGNNIGTSERKSKLLNLTTYYPDGFKRSTSVYNDKGQLEGAETYFYRSGKISNENSYTSGKLEGPSTSYYPNGNKQLSISYTEGEKDGYQKYWYNHGQLQEEGWYQDGKLQGVWLSYNELGDLTTRSEYLNGELEGYKEEFFPDGKKDNEAKYKLGWIESFIEFDTTGKEINRSIIKNGNGKLKTVYTNGKTYSEGTYVNGDFEGAYTFYYFDGSQNAQQFYKKGKLDSIYKNYYYGGTLYAEGKYKDGDKTGIWKYYFANGQLNVTETYTEGKLEGKKTYYFEDGKIDTEIMMEDDTRQGWTKKYDPDGSLVYQVKYESDMPVAYTYFDKTGKLIPEIAIPGGNGKVKSFFSNGNPAAEFEYVDSKVNGTDILYYSNGKIRKQETQSNNLSEGAYKYFYPTGQVKKEYIFSHDNLHGHYKEYNAKGLISEEGYYYNGSPHSTMKLYDENGKLKQTRYYYFGKLLDVKK